ncbi:24684_t:CDS:2, partial [Gigaspora rosea]
ELKSLRNAKKIGLEIVQERLKVENQKILSELEERKKEREIEYEKLSWKKEKVKELELKYKKYSLFS